MRVAIIGAAGLLGSDLMRAFADAKPIGLPRHLFDLEEPTAIAKMLAHHKPDLVINTAAYHNVDLCEMRPDRAMAVNALAVDLLATQCAAAGVALAQISTDYVFDGTATTPYAETDAVRPLNAYGISKVAGESFVWRNSERAYVFRTTGLYGLGGGSGKGLSFIERILTSAAEGTPIRVVTDVTCAPSYTLHVAQAIRRIVDRGIFGTYHVTNSGGCTWYDFARSALAAAGFDNEIEATTSRAFPSLARRPAYSVLGHAAMDAAGLPKMATWEDGIVAYLGAKAASGSLRE